MFLQLWIFELKTYFFLAVAVASGPYIYVYKNLRPYFKFTLPPLDVSMLIIPCKIRHHIDMGHFEMKPQGLCHRCFFINCELCEGWTWGSSCYTPVFYLECKLFIFNSWKSFSEKTSFKLPMKTCICRQDLSQILSRNLSRTWKVFNHSLRVYTVLISRVKQLVRRIEAVNLRLGPVNFQCFQMFCWCCANFFFKVNPIEADLWNQAKTVSCR